MIRNQSPVVLEVQDDWRSFGSKQSEPPPLYHAPIVVSPPDISFLDRTKLALRLVGEITALADGSGSSENVHTASDRNACYAKFREDLRVTGPVLRPRGKRDASFARKMESVAKASPHPPPTLPPYKPLPQVPVEKLVRNPATLTTVNGKKGKKKVSVVSTPTVEPQWITTIVMEDAPFPPAPKAPPPPPPRLLPPIEVQDVRHKASTGLLVSVQGTFEDIGDAEAHPSRFVQAPLDLDDIASLVRSHVVRHLPFSIPYEVKVNLIEQCSRHWMALATECLNGVVELYRRRVLQLIRMNCAGLFEELISLVDEAISTLAEGTSERLGWYVSMEQRPYTQNVGRFSAYRAEYLAFIRSKRPNVVSGYDMYNASRAVNYLRALGFDVQTVDDLAPLHGPDVYEQELLVAADVCAYFRVASLRVMDNIPRIISGDFVAQLPSSLGDTIHQALFSSVGQ